MRSGAELTTFPETSVAVGVFPEIVVLSAWPNVTALKKENPFAKGILAPIAIKRENDTGVLYCVEAVFTAGANVAFAV